VIRVPTPVPPGISEGIAFSDSRKPKPLASLEDQFKPVSVPLVLAVIEMVHVVLRSYFLSHASESKLTNPDEFQEAIRGLKVCKASGPNVIPSRSLKQLSKRAVSFLV
jgi:hypothetical protein